MASLLDLAGYVQKQGELGRQRGEQSRIASLASKAYTAPQADRQSILGQMAQTSPDAAVMQQKQFRQGDSDRMADLSRKAKIFVGMAESGNSQAVASLYPQIAQEARDLGLGDIPLEYNDTFLPGLKKFATILDGNGDNPYAALPSDIQSLKMLQSDPALAALDKERRQYSGMVPKLVETSQGMGWGTPGAGIDLAPINGVAGSTGNGGFGIKETNDYVRSILAKVQGLDPNSPAEKQAETLLPYLIQQESGGDPNAVSPKGAQGLTQVMPATGRDPGFGVSPLRDSSPQENVRFGRDYLTAMLRRYPGRPDLALAAYNAGPGVADRFANPQASAGPTIAQPFQKPQAPSELDRRIQAARDMGASEDEIRRMIIGGNSGRDAQRISAKDATTARQKLTQIKAARQQLASARQAFNRLKGTFSAGLGGNYLPTPEGQAFDRAIRNLTPLITAVTRVPGVGSMSDYESRLQEASLPSRGTYENVTLQQFQDLENLLNTVEGGYNELLSGGQAAPTAADEDTSVDDLLSLYR